MRECDESAMFAIGTDKRPDLLAAFVRLVLVPKHVIDIIYGSSGYGDERRSLCAHRVGMPRSIFQSDTATQELLLLV